MHKIKKLFHIVRFFVSDEEDFSFSFIVKVHISSWCHHWIKITLSCKSEWVWESLRRCCCMCVLRYDWLLNRILDMAPTAVVTLPTLRGSTVSRHTRKTHTYTRQHTHTNTDFRAHWQFHSWEQWRAHWRDPENTPQLPDRKSQIVNGDHTHFPIFKRKPFFNLSFIPKCLVFQTAGGQSWGFVCVADGLAG